MKLTFYGGAKTVTGANYVLEVGKSKVMIDCGIFQGSSELDFLNTEEFQYDVKSISHVFITHSHQDHCGRVPKLVKEGFNGEIVSTPPTKDMMKVALEDSARLIERSAEESGWPPIYKSVDVKNATKLMKGYKYGSVIKVSQNISVEILNAGHILGSAMYKFTLKENGKKVIITFTGDLGNNPAPLLPKHSPIDYTDYLIIESAYGDRNHESSVEGKSILRKVIKDTIWNKGTLLIPSFAIQRTQILLSEINELVESKQIPKIPIFIDSPLAIKMTRIYQKYPSYFNKDKKAIIKSGDDIFDFPGLKITEHKNESKEINNVRPPKIIIAGSGMSTGGRILYHEKMYLPHEKNSILFVGYQVIGTLGRKIFDGEPIVNIMHQPVKVKAKIRAIGGYSAHADQRQLINFVDEIKEGPKHVYIVQGERDASFTLKKKLISQLGVEAHVPKFEETIEL